MSRSTDLVRIADLIKLAAQTARSFGDMTPNGAMSRIAELAQRIEAAAEELADVGRALDDTSPEPNGHSHNPGGGSA